ncbi:MAG: hypothetical protein LQ343_000745 [Gyalolechia ehrenbergii]|nr:MAG: hypothetical protein LQ343_000745 [Gyalolechia ehrenbergii]
MPFESEDVTSQGTWDVFKGLIDGRWLPTWQHPCTFSPNIFEDVILNLIQNPNVNSSLLFRADILYDSFVASWNDGGAIGTDGTISKEQSKYSVHHEGFPGFCLMRTIVRRMIPRNPQLDKPITQTCQIFQSNHNPDLLHTVVIYIPHVESSSEIPWYHPDVQSLAYLHSWRTPPTQGNQAISSDPPQSPKGNISVHYRPFPEATLPLNDRSLRTAHHLLSTLHKHGQGTLNGYTKRVQHDQIIPQQRVQDTYTRLKAAHAKRLCDHWTEQTNSSKHVFEDLSIAAFLIELWKDIYRSNRMKRTPDGKTDTRIEFPGFVDIGCGNGVLVDILLREGYRGWGFDARNRKSWAVFDASTQRHLREMILVPQPLLQMNPNLSQEGKQESSRLLSKILPKAITSSRTSDTQIKWHNGVFPQNTFIISNHADELTPWTPLLAFLSSSPFLAIPCCSHNLSGLRFRAPSKFNGYSADTLAPPYFAANVRKSKSVAITIAPTNQEDEQPKHGSLKDLDPAPRSKQPSAYAALCDWVAHLSVAVGYQVEKEMLRLPSTRNTGILGRNLTARATSLDAAQRMEHIMTIASKEEAHGVAWVERAKSLMAGKGEKH